ncbi:YncE family protein [Candidatus Nitrotoga sp. 1052]|uniref:YncE family protein n=1 Tax=Candidatus Nitrotoga sp. 1052 TaxID=2886964 RepID=UPI001EF6333D|nr:YncE family protein [Candidatus Nitrotoga sp. 1052]
MSNKIYVTNAYHKVTCPLSDIIPNVASDVIVIDGATNNILTVNLSSTTSLPSQSITAIAVNPATNKVYMANGNLVSVIDGATNTGSNLPANFYSDIEALAVNPATNKIYVSNGSGVTVINGETNTTSTVIGIFGVEFMIVNSVTNKIYLADNGTVSVIDGATDNVSTVATTGHYISDVAINPATNKIYVSKYADGLSTVIVIDGATNITSTELAVPYFPLALAVNPVTNKIYVLHPFTNAFTVIDGATNTTNTFVTGSNPRTIALNVKTNKIYVANFDSNNVTVIDGATNTTTTVTVGTHPNALAVNPETNKVYVTSYDDNTVTVIDGSTKIESTSNVVEFFNTHLDNYFITANASEASAIDGGSAGPGWIRTGNTFKSGGSTAVCRFYGSQSPGPNSHFYALLGTECDNLKQLQATTPATEKRWNFESLDFLSTVPINGTCASGLLPVYRAYNNGFARGVDSNHRISASQAAIQEVINRGWINEGVVMCAPN